MGLQMDMQFGLECNSIIFSECLVKGAAAILAFLALFGLFILMHLKKKPKSHKKLVHLFYHGNTDGRAMLLGI